MEGDKGDKGLDSFASSQSIKEVLGLPWRDSIDPGRTVAKGTGETTGGKAGGSLEDDKGGNVRRIGSDNKKGMGNQEALGLALTVSKGASSNLGKRGGRRQLKGKVMPSSQESINSTIKASASFKSTPKS